MGKMAFDGGDLIGAAAAAPAAGAKPTAQADRSCSSGATSANSPCVRKVAASQTSTVSSSAAAVIGLARRVQRLFALTPAGTS